MEAVGNKGRWAMNPATQKTRKPECRPCGDTGFAYPKKNVRHFCGCSKGVQRLSDSYYALLGAAKSALSQLHWAHIHGSRCAGLIEQVEKAIAQATGEVR